MMAALAVIGKTIAGTALLMAFVWLVCKIWDWFEDHEDVTAVMFIVFVMAIVLGIGGLIGHGLYEEIFG